MSGVTRDRVADDAALELLDAVDLPRPAASIDMFLWMMPMPPSWAMVIARRASVTVSMAAETTGRLRRMSRVSRLARDDLARQDLGVRRHQQHVVEGECLFQNTHGAFT